MRAHPFRSLVLIACALLAWFVLMPVSVGGSLTLTGVDGTSMQPLLHTGDLVLALRGGDYQVGDLVVFDIGGGSNVIHRLHEQLPNGAWKTKGDNRDYTDPWTVNSDRILGRYWRHIAGGAVKLEWLQKHPGALGAIAGVLTFLLGLLPSRKRQTGAGANVESMDGDQRSVGMLCVASGAACALSVGVRAMRGLPVLNAGSAYLIGAGVLCLILGIALLDDLRNAKASIAIGGET